MRPTRRRDASRCRPSSRNFNPHHPLRPPRIRSRWPFRGETMSQGLTHLTIAQMAAGLERGDFTSRQLTEAALDRIKALESKINAFITLLNVQALQQADAADRRRAGGERGMLLGVPL